MFYTTSAVDSLPMMKSDYTFRPCMHPESKETYPTNRFYLLERQQSEQCEVEPNSGEKYDPRYFFTGFEISEFTLLQETGIWY